MIEKLHIFEYESNKLNDKVGDSVKILVETNPEISFNLNGYISKQMPSYKDSVSCLLNYSGPSKPDRSCLLSNFDLSRTVLQYQGDCSQNSILEFVNNMTHGYFSFDETDFIYKMESIIKNSTNKLYKVIGNTKTCDRIKLKDLLLKDDHFLLDYILPQKPLVIENYMEDLSSEILLKILSKYSKERYIKALKY